MFYAGKLLYPGKFKNQNINLAPGSFFEFDEALPGKIIEYYIEERGPVKKDKLVLDGVKQILKRHENESWFKSEVRYTVTSGEVLIECFKHGYILRYYDPELSAPYEYPNLKFKCSSCSEAISLNKRLCKQVVIISAASDAGQVPVVTDNSLTGDQMIKVPRSERVDVDLKVPARYSRDAEYLRIWEERGLDNLRPLFFNDKQDLVRVIMALYPETGFDVVKLGWYAAERYRDFNVNVDELKSDLEGSVIANIADILRRWSVPDKSEHSQELYSILEQHFIELYYHMMRERPQETLNRLQMKMRSEKSIFLQRLYEGTYKYYARVSRLQPKSFNKDLLLAQRMGLDFLRTHDRALVADETGFGKTIEVLADAEERQAKRVLIITSATLKKNWKEEIGRDFRSAQGITVLKDGGSAEKRTAQIRGALDSRFLIVNYESLRSKSIFEAVKAWSSDYIIVDEAAVLRSDSQRSEAIRVLAKEITELHPAALRLVTWTPMKRGDIAEIWGLLHIISPERFPERKQFESEFDPRNLHNIYRLSKELKSYLLRRKKYFYFPELPEVLTVEQPVTMTREQADIYMRIDKDFVTWLMEAAKSSKTVSDPIILTKLLRLKEAASDASMLEETVRLKRDGVDIIFLRGQEDVVVEGSRFMKITDLDTDIIYLMPFDNTFDKDRDMESLMSGASVIRIAPDAESVEINGKTYSVQRYAEDVHSGKMEELDKIVEEVVNDAGKIVIFTSFKEMAHNIQNHFAGRCGEGSRYGSFVSYIDGDMKAASRMDEVRRFNESDDARILVAMDKAAGEGIDLHTVKAAVIVDWPQCFGDLEQLKGRFSRIKELIEEPNGNGLVQKKIFILTAKDTIDERCPGMIAEQAMMSAQVLDGEFPATRAPWEKAADYILESIRQATEFQKLNTRLMAMSNCFAGGDFTGAVRIRDEVAPFYSQYLDDSSRFLKTTVGMMELLRLCAEDRIDLDGAKQWLFPMSGPGVYRRALSRLARQYGDAGLNVNDLVMTEYDPSQAMLEAAGSVGNSKKTVVNCLAEKLPNADNSFDVVAVNIDDIAFDTSSPGNSSAFIFALAEQIRSVRPGGYLILQSFRKSGIPQKFKDILKMAFNLQIVAERDNITLTAESIRDLSGGNADVQKRIRGCLAGGNSMVVVQKGEEPCDSERILSNKTFSSLARMGFEDQWQKDDDEDDIVYRRQSSGRTVVIRDANYGLLSLESVASRAKDATILPEQDPAVAAAKRKVERIFDLEKEIFALYIRRQEIAGKIAEMRAIMEDLGVVVANNTGVAIDKRNMKGTLIFTYIGGNLWPKDIIESLLGSGANRHWRTTGDSGTMSVFHVGNRVFIFRFPYISEIKDLEGAEIFRQRDWNLSGPEFLKYMKYGLMPEDSSVADPDLPWVQRWASRVVEVERSVFLDLKFKTALLVTPVSSIEDRKNILAENEDVYEERAREKREHLTNALATKDVFYIHDAGFDAPQVARIVEAIAKNDIPAVQRELPAGSRRFQAPAPKPADKGLPPQQEVYDVDQDYENSPLKSLFFRYERKVGPAGSVLIPIQIRKNLRYREVTVIRNIDPASGSKYLTIIPRDWRHGYMRKNKLDYVDGEEMSIDDQGKLNLGRKNIEWAGISQGKVVYVLGGSWSFDICEAESYKEGVEWSKRENLTDTNVSNENSTGAGSFGLVRTFLHDLHTLTERCMKSADIPINRQIFLSENLFDAADAKHLEGFLAQRFGKDSPIHIVPAKNILHTSTNISGKITKSNVACVISQADYNDGDLWNGNQQNETTSTFVILGEELKGGKYIYLEGVIGLAYAMMNGEEDEIGKFLKLLFVTDEDIKEEELLKILLTNPGEFSRRMRFKPFERIDIETLPEEFKADMENYLVMA